MCAAVSPDAACASVSSAIILVLCGQGLKGVSSAMSMSVPLAVSGCCQSTLDSLCATAIVHIMDRAAVEGSFGKMYFWQWVAICMQGCRMSIPAGLILSVCAGPVRACL